MNLDPKQWGTIVNGLRVAAERFDENAKMFRKDFSPPMERVAEQFDQQAADSRDLATYIEHEEDTA